MRTHSWLAVAFAVSLVGCSGGGGGGGGGDDDDSGPECFEGADDCGGETICIGGACEAAFGRRYRFSSVTVSLPDRDRNGETWDALGGAPDPLVEVWINQSTLVFRTTAVQDVFDTDFSDTGDGTLDAGDSVFIDV